MTDNRATKAPSIAGVDQTLQAQKRSGDEDLTPRLGMTFKTYAEACHYYKQYAQQVGFGATVRNSLYTKSGECLKLVLACSRCRTTRGEPLYSIKTNCPASIRFRLQRDGLLHLVTVHLHHNHPLDPSIKERCYIKMSNMKGQARRHLAREDEEPQPSEMECQGLIERGRLKLRNGNEAVISEFFTSMQLKSPIFFYLMDLDHEGNLRNVFWADPLSRAAYQYFGDVISLNTTCFIEKGDINLVLFVGVNHHCQLVLLGCGLLSDETTETYVWLFNAWLACMQGKPPRAIITDQSKPIQDAVATVLPEARHRYCLWNLMRKMPENVAGFGESDEIKDAFKKVVYNSFRGDEFQKEWMDMVDKFGLEHSEWFQWLYEYRHSWVPVFLRDTFWAGMCNNECCQSMVNFFDGFVHSETSLSEFLNNYEAALKSKYDKEAQADYESFNRIRPLISKFYMEEQLSKLYTSNMFLKFQDELKVINYSDVCLDATDGIVSQFIVKEHTFLENGVQSETREHEVLYNASEVSVQCSCGYFQFHGILCRHVLSVFELEKVYEIPSQYIVSRWRKDYKWLSAMSRTPNDSLETDNLMERYNYLTMCCLQLVDIGIMSDEKYQLAFELIGEVEKHLVDDLVSGDGIKKSRPKTNSKNRHAGTCKADEVISSPPKRRGRPPKKRKDSEIEKINGTNDIMDYVEASLAGNQSITMPAASIASHLGGHAGTRGSINLMEDANLNDITFGSRLGEDDTNQNHVGSQPGAQFSNIIQGQFDQHSIGRFCQQVPQLEQLPRAPAR